MIIDLILEQITFLKPIQSLGAKQVLEHVAILKYVTDLNQAFTFYTLQ